MADIATISDFTTGIGDSEFTGNGELRNIDFLWRKGLVRIANEALLQTGTAFTNRPDWIVPNPGANSTVQQWATDSSDTVFQGTASSTWASAFVLPTASLGAVVWKDHLFLARAANLLAYGPLSGSATLYSFQTITSNLRYHPMIIGQDDILYGGAGRYIFSLQEVDGQNFAAGTAATFTWNGQALDLAEDYQIRCLGESGKNILIGTWKGLNIQDEKVADIFPWDRTSDSFFLPIRLGENGVQAMVTVDNLVYFIAGLAGKLYATDGSTLRFLKGLPQHVIDLSAGGTFEVSPAQMIYHDGKIIFASRNSNLIWSYHIDSDALAVENSISEGTATSITMGGLLSVNRDQYLVGWSASGGDKGIDLITNSRRYTSYSALVTSPYLKLGTKSQPKIISEIEINLARPLASGQGVRLSYRTDLSAAFTLVPQGTVDFATYGAIQEQGIDFRLEVPNGVQLRAELTTAAAVNTSPELTNIILR